MHTVVVSRLASNLEQIVGPQAVLSDAQQLAYHSTDWTGKFKGRAALVVKPGRTQEVAAVLQLCAQTRTPVVPQGGLTGLTGAAIPDDSATQVVLNTSRLNQIRERDPYGNTLTAEAGCVLADIQAAAAEVDRVFPLSLAAEGSCQLGGNLATNAGGIHVIRYGNMRDLVLGLEVVTANGEIHNGLRALRKDNSGYDLKQLFIGSEGTLGIITAAVLKLFPRPTQSITAWLAVPNPQAALELLNQIQSNCAEWLCAFELLSQATVELVLNHIPQARKPLTSDYPWHVLLEFSALHPKLELKPLLEAVLEKCFARELLLDGVIATSESQAQQLWLLRESIAAASKQAGSVMKHDISVPLSMIPHFITQTDQQIREINPGISILAFGHLGDGNIHYNLIDPGASTLADQAQGSADLTRVVHDNVVDLGGSISAEHGLGQLRHYEIERYKSTHELALMKRIKQTLDPQGIMNPGKMLRLP